MGGGARHRRPARRRTARGHRDAADDRHAVDRAGRRLHQGGRLRHVGHRADACSSATPSTASSGRCRSTCRTRSSTTTRTRSGPPDWTPRSRRRRSPRSRPTRRRSRTPGYQTGFGLKLNPWYLEQWAAKANTFYADNQNGRSSRATAAVFDDATGRATFAWMKDMVDSGLARTNPDDGPNNFDNLFGIRSKVNGMTIDTSAALGQISVVLQSGEGGGVELGVGPMPGPSGQRRRARRGRRALHVEEVVAREDRGHLGAHEVPRARRHPGDVRGGHRLRADRPKSASTSRCSRTSGRRSRATGSRTTSS